MNAASRCISAIALALAALLSSSPVHGGMITHQEIFSNTVPGRPVDVAFPTFDPSLGTLTSVRLDRSVSLSGQTSWLFIASPNPATQPIPNSAELRVTLSATFGLGSAFEDAAYDFETSYINPPSQEIPIFLSAGQLITSGTTYSQPSQLLFFQTGPSFSITATAMYETNAYASAGALALGPTLTSIQAATTLNLTYFYEPATAETAVPEPSSVALLGTGLLTACWFRRRRGEKTSHLGLKRGSS
jgi:hypothetical protein